MLKIHCWPGLSASYAGDAGFVWLPTGSVDTTRLAAPVTVSGTVPRDVVPVANATSAPHAFAARTLTLYVPGRHLSHKVLGKPTDRVFHRVQKGRTLTVLDRATPVARIVPFTTEALEVRRARRHPKDLALLLEDRGRR